MKPVVFIAGGGTGGHVYPGLAIAKALQALADIEVVFVGTTRGLEAKAVPAAGYALETLQVQAMKGGGVRRFARGGLVAATAVWRAQALLGKRRPRAVISIGGYAAGPVSLAAALRGIPMTVVEPNSVMGFTNRVLAPFAKRMYVAWDSVAGGGKHERVLGVPIRAEFLPSEPAPSRAVHVLVLGGSQGARALNDAVPGALAQLDLGSRLRVTHQTGAAGVAAVNAAYARAGVESAHVTAYIDDTAAALASADLVVSRAGASTVAEITAIGRAAVFVPFAQAADDHQTKNARRVVTAGGAVLVRETDLASGLVDALRSLLCNPARLAAVAAAARHCGKPHAAARIAADVLALARIPFIESETG